MFKNMIKKEKQSNKKSTNKLKGLYTENTQ